MNFMRYGETAVVRLRPHSVLGSFGVMLISCKVNFHVVRSALQNSVCLLSAYEFADRVFYRSYSVSRHIRLQSFSV